MLLKNLSCVLALTTSLLMVSCTSALKKKCESTNWYEYGEGVAKSGQRVGSDTFVQDCEKADAKVDRGALNQGFKQGLDEYCTPDYAYQVGKRGDFLSEEMCSGWSGEKQMKLRHAEGVKEYCQPSNAVMAGTTGKKYNHICPGNLETAFLPLFNQGRKKYLQGFIDQKTGEIQDMDKDLGDIEQRIHRLTNDNQRIQGEKYLAASNPDQNAARLTQQNLESEIQNNQWEIRRLEQEASGKRSKQSELRKQLREAQGELPTL